MSRTTRRELDELAVVINNQLGTPGDYFVQSGYGAVRLYRDGGAREASPRLQAGQLANWMRAFSAGIEAAQRGGSR